MAPTSTSLTPNPLGFTQPHMCPPNPPAVPKAHTRTPNPQRPTHADVCTPNPYSSEDANAQANPCASGTVG
ncbi:hypothetical protein GCM10026982_57970 [Nocardiopsis aegyptia]